MSTLLSETLNRSSACGGAHQVLVHQLDQAQWNGVIEAFDDARLTQTWSYGAARWGAQNLNHVLLRGNYGIAAAAQVVIKRVPAVHAGMAYVKGGPLWQPRDRDRNPETFRHMLRALREIYATQRKLFLRLSPAPMEEHGPELVTIMEEEGFKRDVCFGKPRTAFLDLSYSLEELRSSLKSTWRRNLVLAERNELTIRHDTTDEIFETFVNLYDQMLERKKICGVVSVGHYQEMQKTLPEAQKMRIMICEHAGEAVAGLVVPHFGKTAQDLLAATGDKGLALRGSYLLHWKMLEFLKTHGCRWWDLDGINHKAYPGISQFKLGFVGRLGWEAEYPGRFELCSDAMSNLSVRVGERLLSGYRRLESLIRGANTPAEESAD
jgi:lipid II:glycine glycyltransferase (peptidoglycan interpeptide bridge formation enzyme)